MQFIYLPPSSPSLKDSGLMEYRFGPLKQNLDFYYIVSEKGHETFMISRRITRTYYVLSGHGHFTIADRKYDVAPGILVEVPPKIEYTYSGKMTLIAFCRPGWSAGNDTFTRWNSDVIPPWIPAIANDKSALSRLGRFRVFGKSPVNAFLLFNQFVWGRLPPAVRTIGSVRAYGNFLHKLVRMQARRTQLLHTFFLRNRSQLQLIQRLVDCRGENAPFAVAVLGCSIGAEVYSIAWTIRKARPDLALTIDAVDISPEAVAAGRRGVYPVAGLGLPNDEIFQRMSNIERNEFFDKDGNAFRIKTWIRQGIEWHVKDVRNPEVRDALGLYDLVIANNFLCHMGASAAEACLRNIDNLVRANGYLLVSGIDLDVRAKVASELKWRPLEELLEEIHEEDTLRIVWPFNYSALEPLSKKRREWKHRYAAAFQKPPSLQDGGNYHHGGPCQSNHANAKASLPSEMA